MTSDYLLPAVQLGNATRRRLGAPFLTTSPAAGRGLTLNPDGNVAQPTVALEHYRAQLTSSLVLTTSYVDIPGATVTLVEPGTYYVTGWFLVSFSVAGAGICTCQTLVDGTAIEAANVDQATIQVASLVVGFSSTTDRNKIAKMQAKKSAAGGTATIGDAWIFAIRIA